MNTPSLRQVLTDVYPLGEAAVTVGLGNEIAPAINARVHALHADLCASPLPGQIESVPAYTSLTLYYDPLTLALDDLKAEIELRLARLDTHAQLPGRLHVIPVVYGGEAGPDLEAVAAETGLTPEEVIAEHCAETYRVYMVGFSPGFPYLGLTSPRIAVPRLPTPRTHVPAGSVALAGRQTGLYPSATPGGWRLIGRTGWRFFDPDRRPPARLQPGDQVQFRSIAPGDWRKDSGPDWGEPVTPTPMEGPPLIRVVEGGLLTTVQDGGRVGFQSQGVPVSGAMDRFALHAANRLVGNSPDAPLLEITYAGPHLQFLDDTLIAVTGADLGLEIIQPCGSAWSLSNWISIYMRRGSQLRFTGRRWGCRTYVAVAGGLRVPPVLGSASTYLPGGLGGYAGRRIEAGDCLMALPAGEDAVQRAGRIWPQGRRPAYTSRATVRVIAGPQWEQFSPETQTAFLTAEYQVTPASDRVGLRLHGPTLQRRMATEIISSGVVAGSVQVPADGYPIVLGADRQTAGGYPQIAVVIGPDLPLLAQLTPGDSVSFHPVTAAEAVAEAVEAVRQERAAEAFTLT